MNIGVKRRPHAWNPDQPNNPGGVMLVGSRILPCAIGRGGIKANKHEGDGVTPIGNWPVRGVRFRADRVKRPRTRLPVAAIRPRDGWCDSALDRNYNRPVTHPYPSSAERLWRDDHLYDLIVVLGYNDCPRVLGRGSAIFMHVAAPDWRATEGCVALRRADLAWLMAQLSSDTHVCISAR